MDIPAVWSQQLSVRYTDVGSDGRMTLKALFDAMQLAAGEHADRLGVGLLLLHQHHMLWVLSRIRLEVLRFPDSGESFQLKTYPSGFNKLFCTRQFLFSDAQGCPLARASSFWLALNADTFRPLNPAAALGSSLPHNENEPVFFSDAGKLPDTPSTDPVVFPAWQSRVDINHHVNNSFFPVMAEDWLAARLNTPVRIHSLQLNYNHELKFMERASVGGVIDNTAFHIGGHNESGVNIFSSQGTFEVLPEIRAYSQNLPFHG